MSERSLRRHRCWPPGPGLDFRRLMASGPLLEATCAAAADLDRPYLITSSISPANRRRVCHVRCRQVMRAVLRCGPYVCHTPSGVVLVRCLQNIRTSESNVLKGFFSNRVFGLTASVLAAAA